MEATAVAPQTQELLIIGEELWAMGDIGPCELVEGRIVPMSPTGGIHGIVVVNLAVVLKQFVKEHKLGWVMSGEVGVYTGRNPDTVRGVDVLFISYDRAPEMPESFLEVPPELAVEIISPGNRWREIRQKISEYFAVGVQQVWIMEPEDETVLVYTSPSEFVEYRAGEPLFGVGILSGLELEVAELFTG